MPEHDNAPGLAYTYGMKKRLLILSFLIIGGVLKGEDAPSVDLFAGWGWSPYGYDGYPCRYGYAPYWHAYPRVGLGVPLNAWGECRGPSYGYFDDRLFWGYAYGVRLDLRETRYPAALSESLLQPFPGSAPTEIRDTARTRSWDQTVESFLRTVNVEAWQQALTNAPARAGSER